MKPTQDQTKVFTSEDVMSRKMPEKDKARIVKSQAGHKVAKTTAKKNPPYKPGGK